MRPTTSLKRRPRNEIRMLGRRDALRWFFGSLETHECAVTQSRLGEDPRRRGSANGLLERFKNEAGVRGWSYRSEQSYRSRIRRFQDTYHRAPHGMRKVSMRQLSNSSRRPWPGDRLNAESGIQRVAVCVSPSSSPSTCSLVGDPTRGRFARRSDCANPKRA